MLEYVFFDVDLKNRFMNLLEEQRIEGTVSEDEDVWTVEVSDDLDDERSDMLEELYDALFDEQRDIISSEAPDSINLVGVQYTHTDGDVRMVALEPALVGRLQQSLSLEELQVFVQSVADQVMSGESAKLCRPN